MPKDYKNQYRRVTVEIDVWAGTNEEAEKYIHRGLRQIMNADTKVAGFEIVEVEDAAL